MSLMSKTPEEGTVAAKHGSYYYAHNRKRDENAPVDPFACGPVKLQTIVNTKKQRPTKEIAGYAWTDDGENKRVKIYITKPESLANISADQVVLKVSKSNQRIKLTISDMDGHDWFLRLNLSHEIVKATFKKKPNKIILFLTKRNSFTWFELTTKNNNEQSSDEEDDQEEEDQQEQEEQQNTAYGPVGTPGTFGGDSNIPHTVSMPACPKVVRKADENKNETIFKAANENDKAEDGDENPPPENAVSKISDGVDMTSLD